MRRALIYGALAVSLFLIVLYASRDATFRARLAYAQGVVSPFRKVGLQLQEQPGWRGCA